MSHFQVMPECYADTLLVEMLGFKGANHQLGIGKVIRNFGMLLKNRSAVGIIDNDKVKPKDLDTFQKTAEREGIIRLSKDKHHILVINPGFKDWVFQNAAAVDVNPEKYGFSNRKDFQRACKRQDVKTDQNVKQLLNTLHQKKAPGFVTLKTWICEATGIKEEDL